MSQEDLPLERTPRRLSRVEHPVTSKEAAEAVNAKLSSLRADVLGLVRRFPGRTGAEYATIWGAVDSRQVGRRLSELVDLGKLRRGEPRECRETGRRAQTWFPVEES